MGLSAEAGRGGGRSGARFGRGGRGDKEVGGFALPATLLTMVGLFLFATGVFLSARAELSIARSHEASVRAFYAAEAALATALAESGDSLPLARTMEGESSPTTVRVERLLRIDSLRALYRLEADARVAAGGSARRMLAILASRRGLAGRLELRPGSWRELLP